MPALELPPLDRWTFDTVLELVRTHEFEPGQFDYKVVLNGTGPRQDEVLKSIQRTACSLANTIGGYILFGVKDRREAVGSPDERIVGIPLGDDLRKQFGDKLQAIQPEVHFDAAPRALPLPADATRGVFVVSVPLSPLRPHRAPDGIFYRRGDGGSAIAMSYYEVRDQMLITEERTRRAALLRLELRQYQRQADTLLAFDTGVINSATRLDTSAFKMLLADVALLVPPSSQILDQLLELAEAANMANLLLDDARHPVLTTGDATVPKRRLLEIQGRLNRVRDLARECDQYLGERLAALSSTPVR